MIRLASSRVLLVACFTAALLAVSPPRARALPHRRDSNIETIAGTRLTVGFAIGGYLNTDAGRFRGGVNPQQFGTELRLGHSYANGLYVAAVTRIFLGQKFGGDVLTSQQFGLQLGYSRPMRPFVAIRPLLEMGANRYRFDIMSNDQTDFGFFAAFGGDVVADVRDHLFLMSSARIGFASMGNGSTDLNVSGGSTDVYVQTTVAFGGRF